MAGCLQFNNNGEGMTDPHMLFDYNHDDENENEILKKY